jgi:hypothetical protein
VEPCLEEGRSELAPVRASVADGANGRKLTGVLEELACLPDGAPARRRGEGALGRASGGLLSPSSRCSGGRARRVVEQNRAWSGSEMAMGRREGKNRLSGAPLIAT